MMIKITVIGAGIVGVATALNIQKKIPGTKVQIFSEKFDQDTTSWGAGGIFRPVISNIQGIEASRLRRWIQDVWNFYSSLATSELAGESGVQIVSGYLLSDEEPQGRLYEEFVFSHRKMSKEEMDRLNFGEYKFLENGGKIQQRKVHSLKEFVGKCDVVVNCTGLGSRELVGDLAVRPVRGQVVRVKAPWIKHFVKAGKNTYIIPNEDVLVLGGCLQMDNYSMTNSKDDTDDILTRCYKLLPSLKGARIETVWTGLRPLRTPLRVEKEIMEFPQGNLKVVHNYGHGASGITLSWGTSLETADLVQDILKTTSKL